MTRSINNNWLTRFALATAVATLVLIGVGGLVTSKGVGMSVPDWPTTYGYNMFLFPISKWVGGIFYEHTHRLMATIVGVLVVCLTRWLGGRAACKPLIIIGLLEIIAGFALLRFVPKLSGAAYFLSGIGGVVFLAGFVTPAVSVAAALVRSFFRGPARRVVNSFRSPNKQGSISYAICHFIEKPAKGILAFLEQLHAQEGSVPPDIQKLGWLAFALVQVQGLLGGLRVVWLNDQIGIFHAALAQLFFVLLCAITLFSSRWWRNMLMTRRPQIDGAGLRSVLLLTTALVFGQLLLGATMRHQHAGLSIPDFPLAYHKIWPAMDANSIAAYNAQRVEMAGENPITAFQIVLQLAHRLVALMVFCLVIYCARSTRRNLGTEHPLAKLSLAWVGLVLVQVVLGAATIWSNKAADVATAHVVTGALTLANGALLTIISFRVLIPARATVPAAGEPTPTSFSPGKPAASSAK